MILTQPPFLNLRIITLVIVLILSTGISVGLSYSENTELIYSDQKQKEVVKSKVKHSWLTCKTHLTLLILELILLLYIVIKIYHIIKESKHPSEQTDSNEIHFEAFTDNPVIADSVPKNSKTELENMKQVLSFFVNVYENNAEIVRLLYNIKINKLILSNPEILEKIEDILTFYKQHDIITKHIEVTAENFSFITGISKEYISHFCQAEQVMLILFALKVETKRIGILLNTSSDSIRTRKMYLKKKIILHGIKLGEQLQEAFSIKYEHKK